MEKAYRLGEAKEILVNYLYGKTDLDLWQLGQLSCFIRMPDGSLPAEE